MTLEEMKEQKSINGISIRTISELSGVPCVTLQKIFSGETRSPRRVTLNAVEEALIQAVTNKEGRAFQYRSDVCESSHCIQEKNAYFPGGDTRLTIQDYYALPKEKRAELIDGEFVDQAAPKLVHQDIVAYIHMKFYNHILKGNKPCKVYEAPVAVRILKDDYNMVEPDLVVVCDRDKLKDYGIEGAPDFVLEVLSKSTRKRDLTVKLSLYAKAGVREYWIIDPDKRKLVIYDLQDEELIPQVRDLEGEAGVGISRGELSIDLGEINSIIDEY